MSRIASLTRLAAVPTLAAVFGGAVLGGAVLGGAGQAAPALSTASPPRAVAAPAPLGEAQERYLSLAQRGVASAEQRWRDSRRGWYDARLGDRERYPQATIWDIVPLFESLDAIAIAQPSTANRPRSSASRAAPSAT